ncbi:MAG: arginyl-tRNA synthetase [Leifsonia xyli]|nr:MAG: arginyl-tRNA synthetase [Leifsonia xyli]
MPRRLPLVSSASVLLAAGVLLAGCAVPEQAATPSGGASTPSSSPSASSTPSAPPSSSAATPVDIPCGTLIAQQAMYDFNPNFSLLSSWTPDAGSAAAQAVAASGVACRWKNDTSGDTIDVSVAAPDSATLEKLKTAAAAGTSADYGVGTGSFAVVGGAGEATVFDGSYWVVVRSNYFLAPGDASPLVTPVLAALG